MPQTNGGIYVELINYKAFIDNIDGLKEGVKQLNTQLVEFANSVDDFDRKLGSAFQELPKVASAAGQAIQKNLIDVIKVVSNTHVRKTVDGFGEAGKEFATAISSISKAFGEFKISTSKLASFEKVFQSLAKAIFSFNAVRNVGNLSELSAFVNQLPAIFSSLSGLNRYLSIIPNNYFTQLGRVVIGLENITQPLARALSAFDQIKVHPGQVVESLDGLVKIIQKLGNINVKSGDTQINFLRAYFTTIMGIAPIISRLASALSPLSGLNASTFTALGDFLPGLLVFIKDFDDFAKQSGQKTSWLKAIAIWAGFNTGSLKQMVNTFKALADGLKKFNDVKIIGGGRDFGDLALGLKRLVEAAVQLQDLAQLAIFNKKTVTKNVEAAFTALAAGLNAFSSTKIPDAGQLSQVARFSKELAKMVNSLQDLDPYKITRAFETVGRILAERGERVLEVAFGDSIAQAIADGLKRNIVVFNDVGVAIAKAFIKGFKAETEIASPSKVFARLGMDVVHGLENGIKGIAQIGVDLAKGLVNGFNGAISGIIGKIRDVVFTQFKDLTYRMGQEFRNFARDLQQTGLNMVTSGGFAAFIQSQAVQSAATFEQTMNQIRVFGNLTREELDRVQNAILEFSAITIFDPQQSAAAFLDLQKAGLSAADALEVLTHVGNLAAAGDIELTAATKGAIQAIQIFSLEYNEAGRVADGFVRAANKSTASVQELIDGMGNVGPLAQEFGLSFEETVAILAQFNDAGIRGAEAGTQLRSMLTNITKPTAQVQGLLDSLGVSLTDANGNFRSMSDIIRDLSGAMHDGTRSQEENFQAINKLAGTYGQMGLAVLLAGENIDDYVAAMNELPGSAIIAEEMMSTFAGRIDSLKGSIQTLIFKALIPLMQEVLAPLFDMLIDFVNLLSSLPKEILAVAAGVVFLSTAMFTLLGAGLLVVGSLLMPLGLALTGLSGILSVIGALLFNPIGLIAGFVALGGAAALLIGFLLSIVTALGAVVALVHAFAKAMKNSSKVTADFRFMKAAVKDLFNAFKPLVKEVSILVKSLFGIAEASATSQDQFDGYSKVLRNFSSFILKVSSNVRSLTDMLGILNLLMAGGGQAELEQLGKRIREFSKTGLAKTLFGDGEVATTQGILDKLKKIADVMKSIGRLSKNFVSGVLGFLSGDIGIGDVAESIFKVMKGAADIFFDAGVFVGKFILQGIASVLGGLRDVVSAFLEEAFDQIGRVIKVRGLGKRIKKIFDDIFSNEGLKDFIEVLMGLEKVFRPVLSKMIESWQSWAVGIATVKASLFVLSKSQGIKLALTSLVILLKTVGGLVLGALAFEAGIMALGGTIRSIVEKDFNILADTLTGLIDQFNFLPKLLDAIGFDGLADMLKKEMDEARNFLKKNGDFATFLNSLFGFGKVSPSSPIVKGLVDFLKDVFSTALQLFKDLWLVARGKILFDDLKNNLLKGLADITGIPLVELSKAFEDLKKLIKDNLLVVVAGIAAFLKFIFQAFSFRFITYLYQPLLFGFRLLIRITTTFGKFSGALMGLAANLVIFIAVAYGLQGAMEGIVNAAEGLIKVFEGLRDGDPQKVLKGMSELFAGLTQGAAGFVRNIFHLLEGLAKLTGLSFLIKPLQKIREFFEQFTTEKARLKFVQQYADLFKRLGEGITNFIKSVASSDNFHTFVAIVTALGLKLREFVEDLLPKIGPAFEKGLGVFLATLVQISEAVRNVLEGGFNAIKSLFDGITEFFSTGTGGDLAQLIIVPLKLVWTIIKLVVTVISTLITVLIKLAGWIKENSRVSALLAGGYLLFVAIASEGLAVVLLMGLGIAALGVTIYGLIGALKGLIFALSGVGSVLEGINDILKGDFEEGLTKIVDGFITIGVGIVAAIAGFVLNVVEAVAKGIRFIADKLGLDFIVEGVDRALATIARLKEMLNFEVLEGVVQGLSDRFMGLVGVIGTFVDSVKENLNLNTLKVIGEYLIQGLWDGMIFFMFKLPQMIIDAIWTHLIHPLLQELGIASPSTLFFGFGEDIIQGLIDGIAYVLPLLGTAATELFNFLKDQLNFKNLITALNFGVNLLSRIKDGFKYAVDFFFDIVDTSAIQDLIKGAIEGLFDFLDTLPTETEVFNAIKGIFDKVIEAIRSVDLGFIEDAVEGLRGAFRDLKNFITGDGDDVANSATGAGGAIATMMSSLNNITLDAGTRDSVMRLGENLIIAVTSGMGSEASKAAITAVGFTMSSLFIEGVKKGFQMTGLVALIGQVWALAILKGFVTPGVMMAIGATAREFAQEFLDRINAMFGINGGVSLKGQAIGVAFITGIASGLMQGAGTLLGAVMNIGAMLVQLLAIASPVLVTLGNMIGGVAGAFAGAGGVIIGTLSGMAAAMNNTWAAANNLANALHNLSGMHVSMPQISSYTPTPVNYTPPSQQLTSSAGSLSNLNSAIASIQKAGKNYNPKYQIPKYALGGRPAVGQLAQVAEGGMSELFRTDRGDTYLIPGEKGTILPFQRDGGVLGGAMDLFRQLQAPKAQQVTITDNSTQTTEIVVNAPLGSYTKDEVKDLFERAKTRNAELDRRSGNNMDAKRKLLMTGRR